jgi:hypothetical protein
MEDGFDFKQRQFANIIHQFAHPLALSQHHENFDIIWVASKTACIENLLAKKPSNQQVMSSKTMTPES